MSNQTNTTTTDAPTEPASNFTIVNDTIDAKSDALNQLGKYLWDNPELRFEETKAHDYITQYLESEGFQVQRHYILPTAFRAELEGNRVEGPTVVVMCEYDALPKIGHACGHNLIAECGVAAGIAIKEVLQQYTSLKGKVVVLGTPAEEGGQGKVFLLQGGAFDGADVAIMAHPATNNVACPTSSALSRMSVKYKGQTAHAGAFPWNGINALDAAVGAYVNVSLLRQQMKPDWRATGIIQEGGTVSNLIPDESQMEFTIRASDLTELKSLQSKVQNCLTSAAAATNCASVIEMVGPTVQELIPNKTMGGVFQAYAEELGLVFPPPGDVDVLSGSTDAGDVSQAIPVLHALYKLNTTATNHTAAYTEATGTQESFNTTLTVAKALALTAVNVMEDPKLLKAIKSEFESRIAKKMSSTLSKL